MQQAWARLLAAVPGSRLLVHPFNPNWSSHYPIKRFCAEFDRVLAAHGVASDRLVVSSVRFPSRTDVRELLRVGDLYLDTFPFAGVNSLIDPLETGVPVITREGETFRSRMGAALLRQLGLAELIVTDEAAYHALGVRLAGDPAARAALRTRITAAMERSPLFLDTLAASDGFGSLLEQAYDELAATGREAFRRATRPITAPDVSSPAHRSARGHELLAAGQAGRATDYFLGAIQHDEQNAALWRNLADALRRCSRIDEAVQALQTSLQLNPRDAETWRLLADLAQSLGHGELHAEANTMLAQLTAGLAPAGARPRVLVFTDDPDAGGVAQYNHSLLVGLTVAGCDVACAQTRSQNPLIEAQRQLGVVHHWIPYDTKTEFMRTLDDQATARRIIEAAKPDLIVFSDCCPLSNLGARDAALQLGTPYVVVVGFVGAYLADRFKTVLGRLALHYARARAVVAVSQENLDLLHNRFGLAADAGQVIHYGRPEQFFAPRDEAVRTRLRAELNLPADAVVCFTAARLSAVKGYLYQVLAAKHLVALPGCEKLHFVWAGDGDQRVVLEQAIISAGLTGRVHLLGHRWDMADWYDAADIFVLPSDLEGMPLAIMEAMAKGLPVVATAVSGIPEELGDTGQLLPAAAQNRSALISQLIRTLHLWAGDPALRRAIGEAGRARATAMFRESLMIERAVALIGAQLSLPSATAVSA
jgi:glycosyltransferase involved in cell wall biosynthesis